MDQDNEKATVQPVENTTPKAPTTQSSSATNEQKKSRKKVSEELELKPEQMWGIFGELVGKMSMYELMTMAQMYRMVTSRSGVNAIDSQGLKIIHAYLNEGTTADSITKETHLFMYRIKKAKLFAKSHDAFIPEKYKTKISDFLCDRAQDLDEVEAHFKKLHSSENNNQ